MVVGPRWVPTVEDYAEIAAVLLGTSPDQVRRLPRIGLAESAIHAPFASFGGESAYTGLTVQAAVLIAHLAQNHPLPDGNKRAAFLLTARFMEANGRPWKGQDVEADAGAVEAIAASQVEHDAIVAWLEERTAPR